MQCASKEKEKPVGELNLDVELYNENFPSLRVCLLASGLKHLVCLPLFTTVGGMEGGHHFGLLDQWVQSMMRLFNMM